MLYQKPSGENHTGRELNGGNHYNTTIQKLKIILSRRKIPLLEICIFVPLQRLGYGCLDAFGLSENYIDPIGSLYEHYISL